MRAYLTDGEAVVPCDDLGALWAEIGRRDREEPGWRRVARTDIGDARVSTVFLILDHARRTKDPPVLFETIVFGGPRDGQCARYHTREEALAGHDRIVGELVRATLLDAGELTG